jgi:hypothetical protein
VLVQLGAVRVDERRSMTGRTSLSGPFGTRMPWRAQKVLCAPEEDRRPRHHVQVGAQIQLPPGEVLPRTSMLITVGRPMLLERADHLHRGSRSRRTHLWSAPKDVGVEQLVEQSGQPSTQQICPSAYSTRTQHNALPSAHRHFGRMQLQSDE